MRDWRKYFKTDRDFAMRLIRSARKRAKAAGVAFTISIDDLTPLPKICPITGQALKYGGWNDWNAASIDRKIPTLGYVPGNVRILSRRANMIRFNCLDPAVFLALAADAREILEELRGR